MHNTLNCLYRYIFATNDPFGIKISALERRNQGEFFLYDIRKDEQLPVPVVFVQYKNSQKASYLSFPQISSDFLKICYTVK